MRQLPKPHYSPDASDPAWLVYATQFHGHLGPWAIAGVKAGMTGRRAVKADGYFDVLVTIEGPFTKTPESCFLDGLQVSTGATLGKRNLQWVKAERIVVRVENTHTSKVAEIRPTPTLMKLVTSLKPSPKSNRHKHADQRHDHWLDDSSLETAARKIAAMSDDEIFTVTFPEKDK